MIGSDGNAATFGEFLFSVGRALRADAVMIAHAVIVQPETESAELVADVHCVTEAFAGGVFHLP